MKIWQKYLLDKRPHITTNDMMISTREDEREWFLKAQKRSTLKNKYLESDWKQRFSIIRKIYSMNFQAMEDQFNRDITVFYQPYALDWDFTDIERCAWSEIRTNGDVVLYPQFPVGKYFIDFANPFLKIGLEMDGKQFHDPAKDMIRDSKLKEQGWTIIRIPGSECYNYDGFINKQDESQMFDLDPNWGDEEIYSHNVNWFSQTCEGVITAIALGWFGLRNHTDLYDQYLEHAQNTLQDHCNTQIDEWVMFPELKNFQNEY